MNKIGKNKLTIFGIAILAVLSMANGAYAAKDFAQCSNDNPTLGNCVWIGSILQASNSKYFEGMSVPQRFVFTGIGTTANNVHTLTFSHQATKGGTHAYDWLTAYNQGNSPPLTLNPCDDLSPTLTTTCTTLRSSSGFNFSVEVPDDPFISKDGSTQSRINAYEIAFGDRQIKIYGDKIISAASLTLAHNVANGGDTGDSFINYTLTWTSASSSILVEMAGHLAVSGNPSTNPIAWGIGLGSSQISGGPYHFKMDELDGASLGSLDNQIKGADILPLPLNGTIIVNKTTVGGNAQFNFTTTGKDGLPASFNITTSGGTGTRTFTNITPGVTYGINETVPAGWVLTNSSSSNGTAGSFVVGPGQTVYVNFTDTKQPTLTVTKVIVPSTDSGLFNLQINGTTQAANVGNGGTTGPVQVSIGTNTVGETAGTGTSLSNYTTVIGGDCAANGTVTLNAGDNKACTITNTRIPTLTVTKITDPTSDSGLFNLQINGTTQAANVGNGGTTGPVQVSIGTNTVGETAGTGTSLSNYTTVIGGDCAANGTVTLNAGDNKACTITNTRHGTIIVNKITIGGDGTFGYTTTGGDNLLASFSITTSGGTGSQIFNNIDPANTYSVNESTLPAGWTLTGATTTSGTVSGSNVSGITVAPGSTVTINFTNTLPPVAKIAPTGTTCSDFTSGTAQTLAQLNYSVKAGAINQVDPGVFFYFTNVTLSAPTNIINVTQSNLLSWKPIQPKINQIFLYNSACTKVSETSSVNSTTGTATMNTSVSAGNYVVQVQYDSTSLVGQPVSMVNGKFPTNTYTFQTDINSFFVPGSTASINVVPK